MRYFTNNPLERLMMQKPKAAREDLSLIHISEPTRH